MSVKILIVDDNAANLTVISGILSRFYQVYPADSGKTALRFLEKQIPDLILLDIEMPDMDGIELFEIIKSTEKLTGIPIVFLTASSDIESEANIFRIGAEDFIRKPINDVVMLARIKTQLELAEYRRKDKI